jgi:hypothetical protein
MVAAPCAAMKARGSGESLNRSMGATCRARRHLLVNRYRHATPSASPAAWGPAAGAAAGGGLLGDASAVAAAAEPGVAEMAASCALSDGPWFDERCRRSCCRRCRCCRGGGGDSGRCLGWSCRRGVCSSCCHPFPSGVQGSTEAPATEAASADPFDPNALLHRTADAACGLDGSGGRSGTDAATPLGAGAAALAVPARAGSHTAPDRAAASDSSGRARGGALKLVCLKTALQGRGAGEVVRKAGLGRGSSRHVTDSPPSALLRSSRPLCCTASGPGRCAPAISAARPRGTATLPHAAAAAGGLPGLAGGSSGVEWPLPAPAPAGRLMGLDGSLEMLPPPPLAPLWSLCCRGSASGGASGGGGRSCCAPPPALTRSARRQDDAMPPHAGVTAAGTVVWGARLSWGAGSRARGRRAARGTRDTACAVRPNALPARLRTRQGARDV